jgi:chorismate mutase/prephenate dehydrogenase
VIDELRRLQFRGIVVDIASLKGHLVESIRQARKAGLHITSIHPMFGPHTRMLAGKVLCLCDCEDESANERMLKLFGETALSIVTVSLSEHDKVISYVLGLSHIMNIVFMKVLLSGGLSYSDLKQVASTTFLSQMDTVTSVIGENPHLYFAIQHFNPFRDKLYREIHNALKTVTNQVKWGEKDTFARTMELGKQWLEER